MISCLSFCLFLFWYYLSDYNINKFSNTGSNDSNNITNYLNIYNYDSNSINNLKLKPLNELTFYERMLIENDGTIDNSIDLQDFIMKGIQNDRDTALKKQLDKDLQSLKLRQKKRKEKKTYEKLKNQIKLNNPHPDIEDEKNIVIDKTDKIDSSNDVTKDSKNINENIDINDKIDKKLEKQQVIDEFNKGSNRRTGNIKNTDTKEEIIEAPILNNDNLVDDKSSERVDKSNNDILNKVINNNFNNDVIDEENIDDTKLKMDEINNNLKKSDSKPIDNSKIKNDKEKTNSIKPINDLKNPKIQEKIILEIDYSKPAYVDENINKYLDFSYYKDSSLKDSNIMIDNPSTDKVVPPKPENLEMKFTQNLKNNKYLKLIYDLLNPIIPILDESKPSMGYQLPTDKSFGKKKKFRMNNNYIARAYGKSGILNIAVHDKESENKMLSKKILSESLFLPNDIFEILKKSHSNFVEKIPTNYKQGTYQGEGIVFIAGDKFSWLTLLSIENLRIVGSKLPIEVIIPTSENYDYNLCENILPKLNAKCILSFEILPNFENKFSGYQYKIISLLISTFEKILFLDSDNIPVSNPDKLFNSEPFLSNNMVTWPDFWRRVTHPKFYELANFKIGSKRVRNIIDKVTPSKYYSNGLENLDNDIPFHDIEGTIPDASSESGQLLINKKTHFKALLLSLYYNTYGPRHYYPLLSQGGKGEGDKETFIAAASFFELPYYQVNQPVGGIGNWKYDEYEGVGMIQYDPIIDKMNEERYKIETNLKIENEKEKFKYNEEDFYNFFERKIGKPMFVHSNYPKLDPIDLISKKRLVDKLGNQYRLYSDQPNIGFDFELRQWQLINKHFCEQKLELNYIDYTAVSPTELCSAIKNRLLFLEETTIRV